MNREPVIFQSAHLSDDALDDLLIDAGSSPDVAHVNSCEACAARLASFRSSIREFNQASAAWSQAKANSMSREFRPLVSSFSVLPAWSIAAAFLLAVALSFLVGVHRETGSDGVARGGPTQSTAGQVMDRQQEIASDNAMLNAIDTALSRPVPSPVEVYGIEKTSSSLSRRSASPEVRD